MIANGTSLRDAVLFGNFRPDRHGRKVAEEPLPAEIPIEGASDAARVAWQALLEEQARAREVDSSNPWRFSALVRTLHVALAADVRTSSVERRAVTLILEVGPLELHSDADEITAWNAHALPYTVAVLARHWCEWAYEAQEWGPTAWAYQHFVVGLEPAEALGAAEVERQREYDAWIVARLRQQGSIGVTDPLLKGHTVERRRELLELARLA
jgi:hypothetical protein